ncbi:MAG: hypothetical protein NTV30_00835, partial [Chloroflexi bacterium]|nr:hypothetical protein [Chloroflexota bacterium]
MCFEHVKLGKAVGAFRSKAGTLIFMRCVYESQLLCKFVQKNKTQRMKYFESVIGNITEMLKNE